MIDALGDSRCCVTSPNAATVSTTDSMNPTIYELTLP
jgi:hypothetical protein